MDVYITYLVLLAWELWDPIRTMQLAQGRRKKGPGDLGTSKTGEQGIRGLGDQGTLGSGDQTTRGSGGQGARRLLKSGGQTASLWRSKNWLNNGIFQTFISR